MIMNVCSQSLVIIVNIVIRHHATSPKVAGSRHDEVNEFFQFT
jgi:hypothetical protein